MHIVLIDDHAMLTQSLKAMLEAEETISSVQTYNSVNDFWKMPPKPVPDVILVDLVMGGTDGETFIEQLKDPAKYPYPYKIIILSTLSDPSTIRHLIRKGASGFLNKTSDVTEILEAIDEVMHGRQYIGKNLRNSIVNSIFVEETIVYHLTPREKQVLTEICKGYILKEIAHNLDISIHTVQYYYRCILNKFKLKRSKELIVFAIQHGLYTPQQAG